MSEIIAIGETPIFQQLAEEYAARGKRFESLTADAPVVLREEEQKPASEPPEDSNEEETFSLAEMRLMASMKVNTLSASDFIESTGGTNTHRLRAYESALERMKKRVEEAEKKSSKENTFVKKCSLTREIPDEVMAGGNIDPFINELVADFTEMFPGENKIVLSLETPFDGRPSYTVSREGDGWVESEPMVQTLSSAFGDFEAAVPRFDIPQPIRVGSIGEDVADSLYMKPAFWGSDEE